MDEPAEQLPSDSSVRAVTSSPGRFWCQTQESFLGRPMTHVSCPYALLWPPTAGDRTLDWRDLWSDPEHLVLHLGAHSRNFLAVPGKSSSVLLIWKASVPPKLLACQRKPLEELQAGAVPVPHPSPRLQPLAHVSLQRAQRSSWLGRGLAKPHAVSPFQPPGISRKIVSFLCPPVYSYFTRANSNTHPTEVLGSELQWLNMPKLHSYHE